MFCCSACDITIYVNNCQSIDHGCSHACLLVQPVPNVFWLVGVVNQGSYSWSNNGKAQFFQVIPLWSSCTCVLKVGVHFPVFPISTYSNLKLYPALSHLTYLNCRPLCLHFLNCTQVASIIPLFTWKKYDNFKLILSSTIIPQWGLVTETLICLGLLKADISKKILTQLFLADTWSLDLVTFLLLFDWCTCLTGF